MELNHHRAGTGETLVLLHGIGSRWQIWQPELDALQARHDVIALDLPGFGASAMPPPGTAPGLDSLCGLVLEFLSAHGVTRPHVAGNSLGGLIALELAQRGAVRSACALSPAGFYNRPEMLVALGTLKLTARLTRTLAPRADGLVARPRARQLLLSGMFARPKRIPPAAAAADMRALADAPWFDATLTTIQPWAPAAGIDVPVTIAWGDKDRLLWPHEAKRAAALIPGARLVTLQGCGHVPTYDDPEQVARVILETTEAVSGAQPARATEAGVPVEL